MTSYKVLVQNVTTEVRNDTHLSKYAVFTSGAYSRYLLPFLYWLTMTHGLATVNSSKRCETPSHTVHTSQVVDKHVSQCVAQPIQVVSYRWSRTLVVGSLVRSFVVCSLFVPSPVWTEELGCRAQVCG